MVTHHYSTDYPLEVCGHKLRIGWVKVDPADSIRHEKDSLAVWLDLDEAVGGVMGFAVHLPVKPYAKREFLNLVEVEVEKAFRKFVIEAKVKREKEEIERQHEKALNTYAEEIQAMLKVE